VKRSRHSAALTAGGLLLVVGGLRDADGALTSEVEWLDPATAARNTVEGVRLPLLGASVAPVKRGEYVAVAGGSDGVTLSSEVAFFRYSGGAFVKLSLANPPRLTEPGRRAAGVATIRGGADMIVLGGYADATRLVPVASSEVVLSASATVGPGPSVGSRGDICAVTLPDGTVIAIGGRTTDGHGGPVISEPTTLRITSSDAGALSALGGPDLVTGRWGHTCTALLDGTVLVTGGIEETSLGQEILKDAWIYTPAPVD
jgi:hypothetical protein